MADTRWLEKRALTYYAVQEVPRPLRNAIGKKRFVRSLGTRDLRVAQARRHMALLMFQREIAAAQCKAVQPEAVRRALELRELLDTLSPESRDEHLDYVLDEAYAIEEKHGEQVARSFHDMATGRSTPLLHYVGPWLAEGGTKGPLRDRTKRQYQSDLSALQTWAEANGVAPTIEAFDRRTVGRYVSEALVGQGVDRKTANRKISAASAYWRWLGKRAGVEGNPWQGQSLSKVHQEGGSANKRPFTDAEVATLLAGDADPELADAIRVAALSGMRIEETYQLRAADCTGGWFHIRRAKTRAGTRRVPIHSELVSLVSKRTRGRPGEAFLFPEAPPVRAGRERSMAISKRFGYYRKRLGVDERSDGQRQSRIDLHSLRRWFITKARADYDRAVVAAIVGHDVGNVTDDVYSGGPSDEVKRACVEAVRLP